MGRSRLVQQFDGGKKEFRNNKFVRSRKISPEKPTPYVFNLVENLACEVCRTKAKIIRHMTLDWNSPPAHSLFFFCMVLFFPPLFLVSFLVLNTHILHSHLCSVLKSSTHQDSKCLLLDV